MRKILVVAHGYLADGLKSSVELITRNTENITTINAYVDEEDFTRGVDKFFIDYNEEEEYIVCTDLFGGSVNQRLISYKEKYDFVLVSGVNLPFLLEIVLADGKITEEKLKRSIENSRQDLQLVKLPEIEGESGDSTEDFL